MTNPFSLRWAFAIWLIILAAIGIRLTLSSKPGSVFPIFATAGSDWLAGEPIYRPWAVDRDLFRYSPTVAAAFAPVSLCPRPAGEILWRLVSAGVLLGGLVVWSRWWWGTQTNTAAMLLLVIPLAVGGMNNGQANALIAGLLLIAQVSFARQRFWWAAACITVCVLFKGYPIALGLLLVLIEPRRFGPRLALSLVAGFALPFVLQRPEFVAEQYHQWFVRQAGDNRSSINPSLAYRDLHQLLRVAGMELSLTTYRLLEVLLAGGAAAIVWLNRDRWSPRFAVWACGAFAACWMTLAGPATESCTWVLAAPLLAQLTIDLRLSSGGRHAAVLLSYSLFTLGAMIVWFPGSISGPVQRAGVQPLAGLLLTIVVLSEARSASKGLNPCLRGGLPSLVNYFFAGSGRSASSSRTGA